MSNVSVTVDSPIVIEVESTSTTTLRSKCKTYWLEFWDQPWSSCLDFFIFILILLIALCYHTVSYSRYYIFRARKMLGYLVSFVVMG